TTGSEPPLRTSSRALTTTASKPRSSMTRATRWLSSFASTDAEGRAASRLKRQSHTSGPCATARACESGFSTARPPSKPPGCGSRASRAHRCSGRRAPGVLRDLMLDHRMRQGEVDDDQLVFGAGCLPFHARTLYRRADDAREAGD